MNYVTGTLLRHLLCFVHGQRQNANKNIQQRTLLGLITIPLPVSYGIFGRGFWEKCSIKDLERVELETPRAELHLAQSQEKNRDYLVITV